MGFDCINCLSTYFRFIPSELAQAGGETMSDVLTNVCKIIQFCLEELYSSPEPKAYWRAYGIGRNPSSLRCPSLNIFKRHPSESTRPIVTKFYIKHL